ncbi:hypothetical protein BDFB_010625 [Asbolus verrucosus]|uniref:Uncharacterized protein n=1 Tax=Asbolus verrucosus TaxID=1661398 RepID=A0A482VG85_ASBVE|nr:hypothetical protein BDFB_010625 [Asbolus verrucosus]
MTEHPNYKYRPRRRKHNKQRATSGTGPRVGTSLPSPSLPNMSPRYSGYIPNASLSPNIQQQSSYGMDFPSPGTGNEFTPPEKRYSPDSFKFNHQFNYVGYQQNYQKSPYSIQTPDASPTQSPEPKNMKGPASPECNKDSPREDNASLPTPELSPMEHEQFEEKRVSSIQHTSNLANTNMNPAQQSYNTRVQNYRQPNSANYTNTQPITSVPMANGMYVMCANKSSVEQGHVVTGTFYPPVATSQDQQLLGSSQNNLSTIANTNIHYYNTSIQQYYPAKDYSGYEQDQPKPDTFLAYQSGIKTDLVNEKNDYMNNYKTPTIEDSYPPPYVQGYMGQEERSDVDSDVDTREFDKYLKFGGAESNMIDSNHNYHRNDSSINSNVTYNFQAQHTSVILPNTSVKPEPMLGHYPEVYDIAQNGVVAKNDDDFSEILADVRKTCYSN